MSRPMRVAYTLEQSWHRVPGGTAVAALETLTALRRRPDEVDLLGVAGTHDSRPPTAWDPGIPIAALPGHGARLYASWLWLDRPRVESVTGPIDLVHATTIIPPATERPLVVTLHDLAFLHEPAHFTRWGHLVFRRSLRQIRERAALVLCSSVATAEDAARSGLDRERLRVVPLGVRATVPPTIEEIASVRERYDLPAEFVFWVGTLEPRKNLAALAAAVERSEAGLPLVVAGPDGWGELGVNRSGVRFLGFVPRDDLRALYGACSVFAYPSLREGFGLPVLEAMASGAPVVTSVGTATEEAAGGSAVLVDPLSITDIARGIDEARRHAGRLRPLGLARAAAASWDMTARATIAAYREVAA